MGAVTYPDAKVSDFIDEMLIPVQLPHDAAEALAYNVKWTPAIFILDGDGKEHHHGVGFLAPDDFIAFLLLGIGKLHFDKDQFEPALSCFSRILDDYPESKSAPEAFYMRGVCLYKSTHDAKPLKEAYEMLHKRYPDSEWAQRASPYRLL